MYMPLTVRWVLHLGVTERGSTTTHASPATDAVCRCTSATWCVNAAMQAKCTSDSCMLWVAPVGAGEVDAQASHFGGQQEHKHLLIGVEVIHKAGPLVHRGGAIHAVVGEACILHRLLQNVQHLLSLCEDQSSVALLLPVIHDLRSSP